MQAPTRDFLNGVLAKVMDPEIPVISVIDMGIIRDVRWDEASQTLHVDITPTYSGCPAMKVIEDDVILALRQAGIPNVEAHRVYSPAWSTNWMSAEARLKLKEYGIAPPQVLEEALVQIGAQAGAFDAPSSRGTVSCPFCDSENTELRSEFGATACKAFYFCQGCRQPFELFKAI